MVGGVGTFLCPQGRWGDSSTEREAGPGSWGTVEAVGFRASALKRDWGATANPVKRATGTPQNHLDYPGFTLFEPGSLDRAGEALPRAENR